ncbi:MAG: thrombospondin type 3 repeat-containing protein, partial [Myxococcota bacterium]
NNADTDDDGDGLLDPVETGTGTYLYPGDTGTNPLVADTDGDGVNDGDEVAVGADPTDASDGEEALRILARAEELCSVAKAKAASRDVGCRMRHSLRAARRGSIADVSTCGTRLASAYDRAEGRYLSCAEVDTATEQGAENQRFVNQRLAAAGVDTSGEPNSGGSALSARCASQTARAIAAHYRCEGQALRQEIRNRIDTATRLRNRCATRIERALDRVQQRYRDACTESPDVASVIAANRRGAAAAASSSD